MPTEHKPLSPHLQIYRLPLTAVLSISHRFTGAFLGLGTLLLIVVLAAAANGSEAYEAVHGVVTTWFGQLLLLLWTLALYFHLCNGFRHLIWDAGYGFELDAAQKSSWYVLIISVLLTLSTWGVALMVHGG